MSLYSFATSSCVSMSEDPQAEILKQYVKDLSASGYNWVGYVESDEVLKELEKSLAAMRVQFSTTTSRSHKSGTSTPMFHSKRGSVHVSLNMPFQVLHQAHKNCIFGTGRRMKVPSENYPSSPLQESTMVTRRTRKTGCVAAMSLKWVKIYPDFQVDIPPGTGINKSQEKRAEAIRKLEAHQRHDAKTVRHKLRIYICISAMSVHLGHDFKGTMVLKQPLDKKVSLKIRSLVEEGITSVREVKEQLRQYVHEVLFRGQEVPDKTCRAFFPKNEIICNHVQAALRKHRLSSADLDGCKALLEKWKTQDPESRLFFRSQRGIGQADEHGGSGKQPEASTVQQRPEPQLLFCYQSKFMWNIMSKHGDGAMRLDVANKSNESFLPVFFVSVAAPHEYVTVGVFVVETEAVDCVVEALQMLRSWCPSFEPGHCTTNHRSVSISALCTVFPQSKVVICPGSREQSWAWWMRSFKDEVWDRKLVITLLRDIADSTSEQELEEALDNLRSSEAWESEQFQMYVETEWLHIKEMWVKLYSSDSSPRPDEGKERENKLLKEFRSVPCRKTLTALVSTLVESLLPAQQQELEKEHGGSPLVSDGAKKFTVPDYLQGRPPAFVSHVLSRLTAAMGYTKEDIVPLSSDGCFYVRSLGSTDWYTLDFGIPSCSCTDFVQSRLPCEHFCAVFALVDGWSLDDLPKRYLEERCILLRGANLSEVDEGHSGPPLETDDDRLSSEVSVTPSANEIDMCAENDIFGSTLALPTATVDVLNIPLCPTAPTLERMRQELRGLLGRCGDLLPCCSNLQALGSAKEHLEEVCNMLSGSVPPSALECSRNSQQDNDPNLATS
ncbi:uncharacterized protein LOC115309605 [Ixodes scapularis]|uniref:uncharacterized protein LOC115309605 n=1 Tax=Ixodes scapularis TaxID=6945 RepID=UPI001A9F6D42|nr:uncharacterized protein LOC115309605 [Ixodes scapularis]